MSDIFGGLASPARIELPPTRREPDYNLPQSAMAIAEPSDGILRWISRWISIWDFEATDTVIELDANGILTANMICFQWDFSWGFNMCWMWKKNLCDKTRKSQTLRGFFGSMLLKAGQRVDSHSHSSGCVKK